MRRARSMPWLPALLLAALATPSGRADVHSVPREPAESAAGAMAEQPQATVAKQSAVGAVDRHAAGLAELSDRIWAYAEIALREHRSAAALADYAERQGFRVQRGVAGMPTAFVAT